MVLTLLLLPLAAPLLLLLPEVMMLNAPAAASEVVVVEVVEINPMEYNFRNNKSVYFFRIGSCGGKWESKCARWWMLPDKRLYVV